MIYGTYFNRFKTHIYIYIYYIYILIPGCLFQTFFIVHFIYGMSSFPLTNSFIFFKMVKSPPTRYIFHSWLWNMLIALIHIEIYIYISHLHFNSWLFVSNIFQYILILIYIQYIYLNTYFTHICVFVHCSICFAIGKATFQQGCRHLWHPQATLTGRHKALTAGIGLRNPQISWEKSMDLGHFRTFLGHFWDILGHFRTFLGHFWNILGHFRDILGHFWDILGHFSTF